MKDEPVDRLFEAVQRFSIEGFEDEFTVAGTDKVFTVNEAKENLFRDALDEEGDSAVFSVSSLDTRWFVLLLATCTIAGIGMLCSDVWSKKIRQSSSVDPEKSGFSKENKKSHIKSQPFAEMSEGCSCGDNVDPDKLELSEENNKISIKSQPSTETKELVSKLCIKQAEERTLPPTLTAEQPSTDEQLDALPMQKEESEVLAILTEYHSTAVSMNKCDLQKAQSDALEVIKRAKVMDQALQQSGFPRDPSLALNWAIQQYGNQQIIHSKQQAECRQYLWDGRQRSIDRAIGERRHSESMSVAREDKDWLPKLEAKRDKALVAISRAVLNGLISAVFLRLVIFSFAVIQRWSEFSLTGLIRVVAGLMCSDICPTTRHTQILPDSRYGGDQTSYLWALASYIVPSEGILEEASYHITCAGRFIVVMIALGTIMGINSALLRIIPSFLDNLLKSAALIFVLSANGWTGLPWRRLSLIQGAISFLGFAAVHIGFWYMRTQLQKDGTPTTAHLNSCLGFFDTARNTIDASFLLILVASLRN